MPPLSSPIDTFVAIHAGTDQDHLHWTSTMSTRFLVFTDTVVNDRQFRTISPPGGRQGINQKKKLKKGNSCSRYDPIKRERDLSAGERMK